jgi:hypothetical protein
MSMTIEQVLGYVPLMGTIQATTTGIPKVVPEAFYTTTKDTIGDSGRYTRVTGQRRTSKLSQYGAPAVRRELKDVAFVDCKLMHTFEEQLIDPLTMQRIRNYDNYNIQRLGIDEIARQVAGFKQLFENAEIATVLQALIVGTIWWDAAGNLLPTSTGAVETVTFQISANNQNQLNTTFDIGWQNATADIPKQLRKLKKLARRLTGYPLRHALYGENVPTYFTNNDFVLDYLSRNVTERDEFLDTDELPHELFGLQWHPCYESFWEDQTSTNQSIIGPDQVIFTPEPSPDWWELMKGSYMVPKTIDVVDNLTANLDNFEEVHGMFGYTAPMHNPPTLANYFGNTWLPVIKVPDAIFQATVSF